ncbi:hypothetical protein HMF8227_01649 [Saliniradius amylolyticus]|uniref:HIT domain-containing protein n=1 Tax=Saliniradius amylolyticus TaxID=2183582 RepID=A0A2S2E3M9_9ALTE|nr:HIT domain-containing protein [Saliniradius amylolyticus]AWL12122.1 hypothetical protein HMF8227_01649 [Saliniradius amylolyticus]
MFQLHPQLSRDCFAVTSMPLSDLLLMNDAQFPWLILVPRVEEAREIIDLSFSEQQTLWRESAWVSEILRDDFKAHKLNVAALGNHVPQLHLHHIARQTTDAAWPDPVWGRVQPLAYTKAQAQQRVDFVAQAINEKIRSL